MPFTCHSTPRFAHRAHGRRWIGLLLLVGFAAALALGMGAVDQAAADTGAAADQSHSARFSEFASADEATLLPEPGESKAEPEVTIQFRREAHGDEHQRRPGRQPATDRATSAPKDRAADANTSEIAAIETTAAAYRAAVAKGDVEAVAKFWTSDADYVDRTGHSFPIKEKLDEAREKQRQGKPVGGRAVADPGHTVRIVTPGVALEDGTFQHSTDADGEPAMGHYTAVWLKRDGRWLLGGVRETAVVATTPADHLKGLQWLVGDWHGEGNGITADVSCVWGPDNNYLLRKVVLHGPAGEVDSTIQWIGWDPLQNQVRSFIFDSGGGFEDGVWVKEDNAWVVSAHGVLPDGRRAYFTNIHSRVDANHVICEIVDNEIDGEPVDDVRLDFKRKAKAAE